jgi:hypothetical protein
MRATLLAALAALTLAACGGSKKAPAPPPPLRPTPVAEPPPAAEPTDCVATNPSRQLPAKIFQQRSIDEAKKLAAAGVGQLQAAAAPNLEPAMRGQLLGEAIDTLITALMADPYNVNATYNLAAGYARVGRRQCAINLLTRLIQMRDHHSRKDEVESKLDRLLGRKRTALDPDFSEMRQDDRFRGLIAKMCEGSNDPACVFGSAPR